ncbi:MAG: L-rhamnose/proton symporter RhaT [Thermoguttaceae bacterium]|nr:L-rhamnose/proton symporter RhaT [Thermoguttaceae bacterium]
MPPVCLGVIFHWLGGLASGSFYVPYKAVKKWSWEVYWLAGGFFSWIIAPWVMASILTKGLVPSISEAFRTDPKAMGYAYLFGCLWGIGGLTFGLTMRYLGMSLGMAIALGYCTVLGTIMPDIANGTFISNLASQPPYAVIILGLGVCLLGVILAGVAGMSKEREMPEEVKKEAIKEFNFLKGILVATISGVFSACMAYGLQAAEPLAVISAAHGTGDLWVGLPKLCVVLLGGFTTNFIWCAILLNKNKTTYQFFNKEVNDPDVPAVDGKPAKAKVNMIWNYFFSALAGTTWYFQFFFYSMGETRMGEYKFSSWTLHMASIIIFSSCWGLALHEWRGSSKFTKFILGCAIFTLLYSTIVVGYGNLMKQTSAEAAEAPAAVSVEGEADAPQIDAAPADAPAADAAEQAEPVADPAADVPADSAFVAPCYAYVFA